MNFLNHQGVAKALWALLAVLAAGCGGPTYVRSYREAIDRCAATNNTVEECRRHWRCTMDESPADCGKKIEAKAAGVGKGGF